MAVTSRQAATEDGWNVTDACGIQLRYRAIGGKGKVKAGPWCRITIPLPLAAHADEMVFLSDRPVPPQ
jgi:hypothetical protein